MKSLFEMLSTIFGAMLFLGWFLPFCYFVFVWGNKPCIEKTYFSAGNETLGAKGSYCSKRGEKLF